jgi:predicted transcriptional regulator
MRDVTVTTRVRARLLELFEAGQFKQARVADRLDINSSAVTRYVNGPTALTLEFLDAGRRSRLAFLCRVALV